MSRSPATRTPASTTDMLYITESSDFRIWAEQQKTNAERLIEDLDIEIIRLNAEVEARQQRRADLLEIVMRADAALVLDLTATRVAPQLSPHVDKAVLGLEPTGNQDQQS